MSVSPQRKDAARNREAILDAARDLMAESPDFPLYEVARRAGVGQATLYRHFPDRAALAATLAAELFEEIAGAVAAHAGTADAFDRLLDTIVDCAVRSHGLTDVVRESPEAWREMERMRDELIGLVEGPLTDAKTRGTVAADVRAEDVFLLLAMIDGALQGVADRARRRAIAERVRHLALRGMAAPPDVSWRR
jgi:AcrR family transcriptional regulator